MSHGQFHAETPSSGHARHFPPLGPFYRYGPGADVELNGWLSAAAVGDHSAFSRLFVTLWSPIVNTAYNVLGDVSQAEEVAQEVMLEVWRKAPAFDTTRGSARAWIHTICRRRAVDRLRSTISTSRREHHEFADRSGTHVAAGAEADPRLDDYPGVRAAVLQLTTLQREAISLTFTAGMTYLAAAHLLGVPEGTFKSRVRQALARLRRILSDADFSVARQLA